jgi:hypothetical protein
MVVVRSKHKIDKQLTTPSTEVADGAAARIGF